MNILRTCLIGRLFRCCGGAGTPFPKRTPKLPEKSAAIFVQVYDDTNSSVADLWHLVLPLVEAVLVATRSYTIGIEPDLQAQVERFFRSRDRRDGGGGGGGLESSRSPIEPHECQGPTCFFCFRPANHGRHGCKNIPLFKRTSVCVATTWSERSGTCKALAYCYVCCLAIGNRLVGYHSSMRRRYPLI